MVVDVMFALAWSIKVPSAVYEMAPSYRGSEPIYGMSGNMRIEGRSFWTTETHGEVAYNVRRERVCLWDVLFE